MENVKFTYHAQVQIGTDRINLTVDDVQKILSADLFIEVGREIHHAHRVHLVFWSVQDRQCFVAVVDDRNKDVITVLPIDYHETCAWPVAIEVQNEARRIYEEKAPSLEGIWDPYVPESIVNEDGRERLTVSVALTPFDAKGRPTVRSLGHLRMNPADIGDDGLAMIIESISEREIDLNEVLWVIGSPKDGESVVLYRGKSEEAQWWA